MIASHELILLNELRVSATIQPPFPTLLGSHDPCRTCHFLDCSQAAIRGHHLAPFRLKGMGIFLSSSNPRILPRTAHEAMRLQEQQRVDVVHHHPTHLLGRA